MADELLFIAVLLVEEPRSHAGSSQQLPEAFPSKLAAGFMEIAAELVKELS